MATLPLDDTDENAAMVNAPRRQAAFIAQKSLAEGFGLTVAKGLWKDRPVAGSAVSGIIDQITDGTGILLPDPRDRPAFGQQYAGCSTTQTRQAGWDMPLTPTFASNTWATCTCCAMTACSVN